MILRVMIYNYELVVPNVSSLSSREGPVDTTGVTRDTIKAMDMFHVLIVNKV